MIQLERRKYSSRTDRDVYFPSLTGVTSFARSDPHTEYITNKIKCQTEVWKCSVETSHSNEAIVHGHSAESSAAIVNYAINEQYGKYSLSRNITVTSEAASGFDLIASAGLVQHNALQYNAKWFIRTTPGTFISYVIHKQCNSKRTCGHVYHT